jgi:predicted transcriptional regulator
MLEPSVRQAILELQRRGQSVRAIARALQVSRAAVRDVLRRGSAEVPRLARPEKALEHREDILRLLRECAGSFTRVHEELTKAGLQLSYPALTTPLPAFHLARCRAAASSPVRVGGARCGRAESPWRTRARRPRDPSWSSCPSRASPRPWHRCGARGPIWRARSPRCRCASPPATMVLTRCSTASSASPSGRARGTRTCRWWSKTPAASWPRLACWRPTRPAAP